MPWTIHVTTTGAARNPIGKAAPRDMMICAYGTAEVLRDGVPVLDGWNPPKKYRDRDGWLRVRHAEKYASRRPGARWEIRIEAPLWSATWRRVRPGEWVCVEAGEGFA